MRDLMDVPVREQRNPRRQLLTGIFRVLDDSGAAWCLSHATTSSPFHAPVDIDCIVENSLSPRQLVTMLAARDQELGARVVQWLDDGSQWIVLATDDATPVILQLHSLLQLRAGHRVYYPGRRLWKSEAGTTTIGSPSARVPAIQSALADPFTRADSIEGAGDPIVVVPASLFQKAFGPG